MYPRIFEPPKRSFFLFGPRGTGKTTWLKRLYPQAKWFNLLLRQEYFRLLKDTQAFRREILAVPPSSAVVVDEIQKLPSLLDEVQDLMSERPDIRFILIGSSARKLKRAQANLLAGRAIRKSLFPLTFGELGEPGAAWREILRWGLLPGAKNTGNDVEKADFLETYASTYLKEEIQEEALVRNIESFSRFLDVAALMNGQILNVSSISRDAGVQRPTVQGFFQILVDTLVGAFLPAFRAKAKVKEVGHPKFYFFDTGVVRVLSGRLRDPLDSTEAGTLFETWMIHEIRACLSYLNIGGELYYWRTTSGTEVDLIWKRGDRSIGIEFKSAGRWKPEYSKGLKTLLAAKKIRLAFGVYTGDARLKDGGVEIYPFADFLALLRGGKILR